VHQNPFKISLHFRSDTSSWHTATHGPANGVQFRAAKPFTTIWDSNLRGFGLSTGKAKKSFIVLVGSGRRHTIGVYPLCSLPEARSLARTMLAEKMLGKIRPKHVAFDDARDDFLKDCEPRLRPRTYRL
jgi:hypothetical protein